MLIIEQYHFFVIIMNGFIDVCAWNRIVLDLYNIGV